MNYAHEMVCEPEVKIPADKYWLRAIFTDKEFNSLPRFIVEFCAVTPDVPNCRKLLIHHCTKEGIVHVLKELKKVSPNNSTIAVGPEDKNVVYGTAEYLIERFGKEGDVFSPPAEDAYTLYMGRYGYDEGYVRVAQDDKLSKKEMLALLDHPKIRISSRDFAMYKNGSFFARGSPETIRRVLNTIQG